MFLLVYDHDEFQNYYECICLLFICSVGIFLYFVLNKLLLELSSQCVLVSVVYMFELTCFLVFLDNNCCVVSYISTEFIHKCIKCLYNYDSS